jgi:DNA-binding response OmpR family regulator
MAEAAPAPAGAARVLLVEDDPSIRRFVALALEDLPVQVVEAPTLQAARDALDDPEGSAFVLMITDLMLPDGSGMDVLRDLRAGRRRRVPQVAAAFSAGLTAARRAELEQLGVNRWLAKPVSLIELSRCVQEALDVVRRAPDSAFGALDSVWSALPEGQRDAVMTFFAGDRQLFQTFRDGCRQRFAGDLVDGERAVAEGDLAKLRRLAHSLASVLEMIGEAQAGRAARRLEMLAGRGEPEALREWAGLALTLERLAVRAAARVAPGA